MKNPNQNRLTIFLLLLGMGLLFSQGCSVSRQTAKHQAVTVPDIVQMSKAGVSPDDIIKKIRKSHTVYKLSGSQYGQLGKEGVSGQVLNYMQKSYVNSVRQNQQLSDSRYWWPGWDGYWYGGPAFGWPYGYWSYNWGDGVNFGEDYEGTEGEMEEGEGEAGENEGDEGQ